MALDVYLTNACNLSCKFCFNLEREDSPRIPLQDICNILKSAYENGNRYVSITGGEPFLYKQVFHVLDYAHDLGYWTNILSHGGLLNEEKVERLKNYWRTRIRISLDGPTKEAHDALRGEGTFENTVDKIDLLVRNGINTGIGFTASEHNVETIEDLFRFCIDRGVSFLRISPVARVKKGKSATVNVNLHERILDSIIRNTIKYRSYIDLAETPNSSSYPISLMTTKRCMAGKQFYGITPDKKILPCPLIIDHPRFESVYYESKDSFKKLNKQMDVFFTDLRDNLKGKCQTCEFKNICYGGCLAEKLSFENSLEDGQPVCTKDILEKLVENYPQSDINQIVNSWMYKYHNSLEQDNVHTCMRQAPFWNVDFKFDNQWKDTDFKYM